MVVLPFSVLKEKILNGTKEQTIRLFTSEKWQKVYKHHIKGDKVNLQIYFNHRQPNQEFLFNAILTDIYAKEILDITNDEMLRDGFTNADELYNFFITTYNFKSLIGVKVFIIRFKRIEA